MVGPERAGGSEASWAPMVTANGQALSWPTIDLFCRRLPALLWLLQLRPGTQTCHLRSSRPHLNENEETFPLFPPPKVSYVERRFQKVVKDGSTRKWTKRGLAHRMAIQECQFVSGNEPSLKESKGVQWCVSLVCWCWGQPREARVEGSMRA